MPSCTPKKQTEAFVATKLACIMAAPARIEMATQTSK